MKLLSTLFLLGFLSVTSTTTTTIPGNTLSPKARAIYKHVWEKTFAFPSEMSVTVEHLLSSGSILTDVNAYGDGTEHCELLYQTVMRAEEEVLIGTYTFDRTSLCGKLARAAIEKLNARSVNGKKVRVYALIDAFSQLNIWKQNPFKVPVNPKDIISDLRTTDGQIFGLPKASTLTGVELVVKTLHVGIHGAMHSKMLVVDGRWVVSGSKNWEALPAHEYSALIEGPIANSFRSDFQRLWNSPLPPLSLPSPPSVPGGVPMLYLGKRPYKDFFNPKSNNAQVQAWIKAVELAQKYIVLISPNVNTKSFMKKLMEAMRRGVRVVIITNWSFHDFGEKLYPDSTGSNRDNFDYLYRKLGPKDSKFLTACYFMGKRVAPPRPLEKEFTHAKYMDVDGEFSIFGSGNFDPQAFYFSSEANVLVDDPRETQRITAKLFSQQQSLEHCYYDYKGVKKYNATSSWAPV